MPKLIHYRNKCIGCGSCALEQPEHWEMDTTDGRANLKNSKNKSGVFQKQVEEFETIRCKSVVDLCPVNCIKFDEK